MPRRGSPSPPLLSLPLLIISLPIIAFLLLFFVVPSFLSLTTHKTKPAHTVKSSWDSLNILLVLFAILCGVFARRNDDESSTTNEDAANTNVYHHGTASHVVHNKLEQHAVSDTRWSVDQFSSDQKIYGPNNSPFGTPAAVTGRLKRNSSSYPDLRQESFWETGDDRLVDDLEINKYRRSPIYHGRNRSDDSNVKEIPIDTVVLPSSPLSPSPPPPPKRSAPPPPPPPQTTTSNHRPKRTHRIVTRKIEKVSEKDHEFTETKPPTPPPPPPPPQRLAPPTPSEKKKIERKKSNATKEIKKMVFASLYRKTKKKQKTRILPDETHHSSTETPSFTTPPPPPPPPPPLPSMFQSLFRKGSSKSKRIHSFSASVPPPPPPPPPPLRTSCKHKNQKAPPAPPPPPAPSTPPPEPPTRRKSTSTGRPPLPTRFNNFQDENFNSGGQSPLIPMPPPPPPPPFRVPGFQFLLRGDFVKVRSAQSSRCGSPELEDIDGEESNEAVKAMDGRDGIGGGSGFCPSPDVNIKADTFIARLRDEWRLEKINSFREKGDVGRGPGLGQ